MKLLRRRFLHLDRIGNKDEGLHRLFLYLFEAFSVTEMGQDRFVVLPMRIHCAARRRSRGVAARSVSRPCNRPQNSTARKDFGC
jgi:hypothetical protein